MYDDLGEFTEALKYQKECLEIERELLPAIHPGIATTLTNTGVTLTSLCKYDKALEYFYDAVEMRRKCLPASDPRDPSSRGC